MFFAKAGLNYFRDLKYTSTMQHFEIQGGKKLKGRIDVRGSKNATTPILAATLLTRKKCVISNIPLIEDVFRMIEILESLGAEIKWLGERKVSVRAKNIQPEKINIEKVKLLRSSILLLGPLSARFNKFKLYHPGRVCHWQPAGGHAF